MDRSNMSSSTYAIYNNKNIRANNQYRKKKKSKLNHSNHYRLFLLSLSLILKNGMLTLMIFLIFYDVYISIFFHLYFNLFHIINILILSLEKFFCLKIAIWKKNYSLLLKKLIFK